mgnify:FL=1
MKKSLFPGGNRVFFAYKHNGIKAFAIEIGILHLLKDQGFSMRKV